MHAPPVKPGGGARWRWMLQDLLASRASWLLALSFAAVYIATVSLREDIRDTVHATFGLSRQDLLAGKIWQIFTHPFLHGNEIHLMVNALGLLLIGPRVERIYGPAAVLKVFLAGVVAGGLFHVLLSAPRHAEFHLVGASGGLTAMLLWLTTVSPDSRMRPIPVSGKNLGRGILLAEAGFLIAAWIAPDSGLHVVSHACHLGGGLAGWLLGRRLLRPRVTLEDLQRDRARREGGMPEAPLSARENAPPPPATPDS